MSEAAWIQTHTGRAFEFERPTIADICVEDIAWSLARQCRFGGHCKRHYSVAQHAVNVSLYLELVGAVSTVQWLGLHHDDAEAYLPDLPAPIKHHAEMAWYREVEEGLARMIAIKFDLPSAGALAVDHADKVLLATEAAALLGPAPRPWSAISGYAPDDRIEMHTVSPARAYELYMQRYAELARRVGYERTDEVGTTKRCKTYAIPELLKLPAAKLGRAIAGEDGLVLTSAQARRRLYQLLEDGYTHVPACTEYDERGMCAGEGELIGE